MTAAELAAWIPFTPPPPGYVLNGAGYPIKALKPGSRESLRNCDRIEKLQKGREFEQEVMV